MQINEGLTIIPNKTFLKRAEQSKKELYINQMAPQTSVRLCPDDQMLQGQGVEVIESDFIASEPLGKDDEIIIDFGTHVVGTIEFDIEAVGSPPDAPLLFDLQFAEMPVEFTGSLENYEGWISKSWLQTAREYVDVLDHHYTNSRRYSFRYMKIKVWDTSKKFKVVFKNIKVNNVSSVKQFAPSQHVNELYKKIADASMLTLRNCMQEVYEDGPKRDRRLWLGDLYLQAQANYYSFNDQELVKRCLYLFAGVPDGDKRITANLFIKPNIIADDTYLVDYSMHFINTLADYDQYIDDEQTVKDLYQTAKDQIEFGLSYTTSDNLFEEQSFWWSFFDWNDDLIKSTAMHGLFIFSLGNMRKLAEKYDQDYIASIDKYIIDFKSSAVEKLYNNETQMFEANGQYSMHSQIWMVLADVLPSDDAQKLMLKIYNQPLEIKLVTPYAQHFFVEALIKVGLMDEAKTVIKKYWGGMISLGADTFWELFDPEDVSRSPYGSHLANSYCHAWSCTPIYFINKYDL